MQADFWFSCWKNNEIGFHEQVANPLLVKHLHALSLEPASRVFLPLCGKTSSIPWLCTLGHEVVGVELSQIAVDQLFEELAIDPVVTKTGNLLRYASDGVEIFVGDIFELDENMLGLVDAIYDRGALVALPEGMRRRYTKHLKSITACAEQLLICYEYDSRLKQGPPFSITMEELESLYHIEYQLALVDSSDADFGDSNLIVSEKAWLLKKL